MTVDLRTSLNFPGRKPRQPLRTFSELVEELGLKRGQVANALGRSPDAPKPVHIHRSTAITNTWYEPREFRAWAAKQVW